MLVIDFETHAIGEPGTRPVPVGVALWEPGRDEPRYLSWGHPGGGNNSSLDEAKAVMARHWDGPVLAHNAGFDFAIAEQYMGLPWPMQGHDTMVAAFVADSNQVTLGLKPLGEGLLGVPPDAQDALREWLVANVLDANERNWGRFICEAPTGVVEPYACQDVNVTRRLFELFKPSGPAYEREMVLLPVLWSMERAGVRIDQERLAAELPAHRESLEVVCRWCADRLGITVDELDSRGTVADALAARGMVEEFKQTDNGQRAVNTSALTGTCADTDFVAVWQFRATHGWQVRNLLEPWLAEARGRIHAQWHSTLGSDGFKRTGARTGRISSSPNLQNLSSRQPEVSFGTGDGLVLPPEFAGRVGSIARCRSYLIPDEGEVFIGADFDGQEMRCAAHFEDGQLAEAFREDPHLDPHLRTRDLIEEQSGLAISRRDAKTVTFSRLYGAGAAKLASQLGVELDEATQIREALRVALPGLASLDAFAKKLFEEGGTMKSAGGRVLRCEPPTLSPGGLVRHCSYKAVNTLIQSSSADLTKQAMIDFAAAFPGSTRLSIHDELVASVPPEQAEEASRAMVAAMEDAGRRLKGENWKVPLVAQAVVANNLADLKG